jgi:hypothetical protein
MKGFIYQVTWDEIYRCLSTEDLRENFPELYDRLIGKLINIVDQSCGQPGNICCGLAQTICAKLRQSPEKRSDCGEVELDIDSLMTLLY